MPTYEYVCESCDHKFDEFQSFKEATLTDCPKCAEPKLRRLFGTGAAILFKGSGFYETDYRSESYKNAAKADKDGAPKAAGKEGGKDGAKEGSSNGSAAPAADSSSKSETKTPKPSSASDR